MENQEWLKACDRINAEDRGQLERFYTQDIGSWELDNKGLVSKIIDNILHRSYCIYLSIKDYLIGERDY